MTLSDKAIQNKKEYTKQYRKENYKRIPLEVTHEKYEEIKVSAQESGETVNGFIKSAIDQRLYNTGVVLEKDYFDNLVKPAAESVGMSLSDFVRACIDQTVN